VTYVRVTVTPCSWTTEAQSAPTLVPGLVQSWAATALGAGAGAGLGAALALGPAASAVTVLGAGDGAGLGLGSALIGAG